MLRLDRICASYGRVQALFDFSLEVRAGEILCLVGRNGAGKSTVIKAIMGLLPISSGTIEMDGKRISDCPPHRIAGLRIGLVPQGRRLFAELTVAENLEIGLMVRGGGAETREMALELFPRLRERLKQVAGTLSGGEQQMLATARALCIEPRVILLDEPTEGLQPSMITQIRNAVLQLKERNVGILLVEQRVDAVLELADRVCLMETGRNVEEYSRREVNAFPALLIDHLGI